MNCGQGRFKFLGPCYHPCFICKITINRVYVPREQASNSSSSESRGALAVQFSPSGQTGDPHSRVIIGAVHGSSQTEPGQRRGWLNCVLPLGPDVASPPVCRCLHTWVPASCHSILPGESPSSSSRRECGADVRPPPSESELSLSADRAASVACRASAPEPQSGAGSRWRAVPASAVRRCALNRGLPDSRLVGC